MILFIKRKLESNHLEWPQFFYLMFVIEYEKYFWVPHKKEFEVDRIVINLLEILQN